MVTQVSQSKKEDSLIDVKCNLRLWKSVEVCTLYLSSVPVFHKFVLYFVLPKHLKVLSI